MLPSSCILVKTRLHSCADSAGHGSEHAGSTRQKERHSHCSSPPNIQSWFAVVWGFVAAGYSAAFSAPAQSLVITNRLLPCPTIIFFCPSYTYFIPVQSDHHLPQAYRTLKQRGLGIALNPNPIENPFQCHLLTHFSTSPSLLKHLSILFS